MLRAQAQTFTFEAIDAIAPPSRKSGLTSWASGECQIWNGTTFVNTTNTPVEIGSTGRYSLVLTAAEMRKSWLHVKIVKAGMQDADIRGELGGDGDLAVVSDAGNTATTFVTDLTSSVTDFYKGALIRGTTGANAGCGNRKIGGYNATTKAITLEIALPVAPTAGDLILLVTT
jgi:hypothetical protein